MTCIRKAVKSFKGIRMGPLLILVCPCFRENVIVTCKIVSFLDNFLLKNVFFFVFEIKFQNGSHLKIAFCQGLAFYLLKKYCASALMMKWCASGERLASLVFRLRRTLAPSALDTRASRSWLISLRPC